ncbi:MAG: hypothetical protein KJ563_02885, partial [Candidatus Thermoplasmatota archaeon]|nr:hypothetical protein [Candidatus Thermoplasmatota archaeon]
MIGLRSIAAASLSVLLAFVVIMPVSPVGPALSGVVAASGPGFWGISETFSGVLTGTHGPVLFGDFNLSAQSSTESVVLDGWLFVMTREGMSLFGDAVTGTVATYTPSGPAERGNDWNISAEITRPVEDSAYLANHIENVSGRQGLTVYLTNSSGTALAGVELVTGHPDNESIRIFNASDSSWTVVARDMLPALTHDYPMYGAKPDRYVVSFAHANNSPEVQVLVRNSGSGVVYLGNLTIPTIEGANDPSLRFDIYVLDGRVAAYFVASGWIIDNVMFRSLESRYPVIEPVYEFVSEEAPLWLEIKDIDGNRVTDAAVSIEGEPGFYNWTSDRYEIGIDRQVDWDIGFNYTVTVDGVVVNDRAKVSTTPSNVSRVSIPKWWNGWDWVSVLGRDDSYGPDTAISMFQDFDHPKTAYIFSTFQGNSTELLATQSEIAMHYPHDFANWGQKFWDEAVTSAGICHSTFEDRYWFASRWDDPRYVGKGDTYISIANPGNSASWEQMFAHYLSGTRLMGISSQYYLAGNSSLIGSYWMYAPLFTGIPSWASWDPHSRMDMMDMWRSVNTDHSGTHQWLTAFNAANNGGVLRVYNHGIILNASLLYWIVDNKTNSSYENWKATDGEVASYIYGRLSTDIDLDSRSTSSVWMYDISRQDPTASGYWRVPVTVAVDITDELVEDIEIADSSWNLKMSTGTLQDLAGKRIMDVGYDIRGTTLYVSYFWNASSELKITVRHLTNPRILTEPDARAIAYSEYSTNFSSTLADSGSSSWILSTDAPWLSIQWSGDGNCLISGFPTSEGTFTAELTVSDENSTETVTWTITVTRPKTIRGHVQDSGGNPLYASNVIVVVKAGNHIRAVQYAITDKFGFYMVTFDQGDWNAGNTIEVSASNGSETATNSTDAHNYPHQEINVRLATEVPEFGHPIVFLLAVSSAMIAVFGS